MTPRLVLRLALASALGFLPAAAAAQQPHLEAATARLSAGDYDQARALVDEWWREHGDSPAARERPLGLLLRGRLTTDIAAAERDYLAIVLGHPTSREAPEALLRLGQGLLAAGEPERAAAYLERLLADYPGAPQRWTATLWLGRSHAAAGRVAAACQAFQDARGSAATPDALTLVQREEARVCGNGARRVGDTPPAAPPIQPQRAESRPRTPAEAPATGRFAVQLGAFRDPVRAEHVAAALRRQGHEPRVVRLPGSGLARVRVGRFPSAAAAEALRARLAAAGFEAVVVGDASQERPR